MKPIFIIMLWLCSTTFSMQAIAQKKVPADFPKEMLPEVKVEYQKQYDKGQILYSINCAHCHNTGEKKKAIIPDFTREQLKGYELRESNPQHIEGMPETQVTAEELGLIMTFLNYKKKNPPAK